MPTEHGNRCRACDGELDLFGTTDPPSAEDAEALDDDLEETCACGAEAVMWTADGEPFCEACWPPGEKPAIICPTIEVIAVLPSEIAQWLYDTVLRARDVGICMLCVVEALDPLTTRLMVPPDPLSPQ